MLARTTSSQTKTKTPNTKTSSSSAAATVFSRQSSRSPSSVRHHHTSCVITRLSSSLSHSAAAPPGVARSKTLTRASEAGQGIHPSDMGKVGFIGLGIMGKAMAVNLVKAGYDVVVWNRTQAKVGSYFLLLLVCMSYELCFPPVCVLYRTN